MYELAFDYTIVILTHNVQQVARVSNGTAFFTAEADANGVRHGRLRSKFAPKVRSTRAQLVTGDK